FLPPVHSLRPPPRPPPAQDPASLVLHLDVVVILGPVVTDEQQCLHAPNSQPTDQAANKSMRRANGSVLTPAGGHDIPSVVHAPDHRRGHGLRPGLKRPALESAHSPTATRTESAAPMQQPRQNPLALTGVCRVRDLNPHVLSDNGF